VPDETTFKTVLGMCQIMLRQKSDDKSSFLSGTDIRQAVEEITALPTFTGVDKDRLVAELEERFTVYAPLHQTLGQDDDHKAWLFQKLGAVSWRYWDRYRLYLEDRMPGAAVESLERVANDVLGRLEDPERSGMWDRRGLVMGHVQSGKTANFCGLICKAADAGYKVVIVLSGIHNSLRSQTQIRLDEGFLGFMSEPRAAGQHQTFKRAGVGLIDGSIHANAGTNRTERGDFSTQVANQFGIHPGGLPLIFVVKKNATVLKNLLGWIQSCADAFDDASARRFISNVPLLVIDDEADLASIDTREQQFDEFGSPDLEHDPAKINGLIRQILRSFEKVAYVGYTATPFANIFIHDRGHTRELGDDLFPRSFIVNIAPPSNYVGPARTFGINANDEAGLEEIHPLPVVRVVTDHADSDELDEENGWMPPKLVKRTAHRPLYDGKESVPPSLREAILAFLLTVTVRKLREPGPHHNSMLVHVVRYTNVQQLVAEQVSKALRDIVQRLQNGDGDRSPGIIDELHDLWTRDFVPTNSKCQEMAGERAAPPLPSWDEVSERLKEVALSIHVRTINGSAGDILDYEENRMTGLNVIAVGGDKLSRGLTLEGLSVSYFLRASRMYDTLIQMGRWFGYRDGYLDVCRLYTAPELLEWFTHIAAASEELQREFQHMVNVGGTPKDYGLRVRSHPVMLVTSAVKMRNGTNMQLSFSGDISETIIFNADSRWNAQNLTAVANWLDSLGRPDGDGSKTGGYTWKDVDVESVLTFLASYRSHEDAVRANTALLSRYIKAQSGNGELKQWTVRLVSSGKSDATPSEINGLRIGLVVRAQYPKESRPGRYTIRRLVSPTDEMSGLSPEQRKQALDASINDWEQDKDPGKSERPPEVPGGRQIRQIRPKANGLILLYPLDPQPAGIGDTSQPIIGIAISFPKSDTAREISYTVNNVFTRRGGDDDSL
jgi:hypothetical protein